MQTGVVAQNYPTIPWHELWKGGAFNFYYSDI